MRNPRRWTRRQCKGRWNPKTIYELRQRSGLSQRKFADFIRELTGARASQSTFMRYESSHGDPSCPGPAWQMVFNEVERELERRER